MSKSKSKANKPDPDGEWTVVDTQKKKSEKQAAKRLERHEEDQRLTADREARMREIEGILAPIAASNVVKKKNVIADTRAEAEKKLAEKIRKHEQEQKDAQKEQERKTKLAAEKRAAERSQVAAQVQKQSIETVQVDAAALQKVLSSLETRFPESHDVQLKGLAEHFETIFAKVKVPVSQAFASQIDVPYSYLDTKTVNTVTRWIDGRQVDALSQFLWFVVTTLFSLAKGEKIGAASGVGLQLLLQLIARRQPLALCDALKPLRESGWSIAGPKGISIAIWAMAQTIKDHPNLAFLLWYEHLLPFLSNLDAASKSANVPHHSKVEAAAYIGYLLQVQAKSPENIDERVALGIVEQVLKSRAKNLQDPLLQPYSTKLVDPSNLFADGAIPAKYFALLLSYSAAENKELRQEVLPMLVKCLQKDNACYQHWKDVYVKYIAQSNNLLLYIVLNWDLSRVKNQLAARDVQKLVDSIQQTNTQLVGGTFAPSHKPARPVRLSEEDQKDISMCTATCKALEKKLPKVQRSPKYIGFIVMLGLFLLFVSFAMPHIIKTVRKD